jgi:hypothetical protein
MNTVAILITVAAWASLWFFRESGTALKLLRFMLFLSLGVLMSLVGGLSYLWDSSAKPDQASATILVCGILTLLSQFDGIVKSLFEHVDPDDYPPKNRRR